jgi:c-opsin
MVLLMILAFMTSWFPYSIICFIKITEYDVTPTVSALGLLFAKSSICWNPIIYIILNEQVIKYI